MTWYKKLGFSNNPFSIKPAAYTPEMVAYDVDYLIQKIRDAELLFIEGQYGTGKTTILKTIINSFKGRNKIVYYSFNSGTKFNLKALLDGANSTLRKLTGFKHTNMILLLDEVHTIEESDSQEILNYYQEGILQSVVFVSHSYDETQLSDEVKSYLKGNVVKTIPLTIEEAYDLIRSRIGDIELFSKKSLKRLFDLAEKNPRRFLEYCEDVARYAVEREEYQVTDEHIDAVVSSRPQRAERPRLEERPQKKKEAPERIVPHESQLISEEKPRLKRQEKTVELVIEEAKPEVIDEPVLIRTQEPAVEEKPLEEIEIVEEKNDEEPKRQKKYKVNKLVEGTKDALGEIQAKDESDNKADSDVPEYKVFAFDN